MIRRIGAKYGLPDHTEGYGSDRRTGTIGKFPLDLCRFCEVIPLGRGGEFVTPGDFIRPPSVLG